VRYWLLQFRKARKLTQVQVANLARISRSYYADIERGRRDPSGRAAKRIADALGFDMNLFFADERLETSQTA